MLKKFLDGLMFGSGFTIAFIVISYLAAFFAQPLFMSSMEWSSSDSIPAEHTGGRPPIAAFGGDSDTPFYELAIDEKIKRASVIAVARYEQAPDGQMKAIIKEFLKNKPDTTIYYKVGDEFPTASYFPKEDSGHGDGVVIFFVGSRARMRMTMTFSGKRIGGLGDLPIKLLREKCKDPDAASS